MRIFWGFAPVLLGSVLFFETAAADSRDDALEIVQTLTVEISERLADGTLSDEDLWAGVQGLTDAFNRFALSETEVRSDEKVEPPLLSSLRPGEQAQEERTRPGSVVSLGAVPRYWFTKAIADSRRSLDRVRELLESNAPHQQMLVALDGLRSTLALINRPPENY